MDLKRVDFNIPKEVVIARRTERKLRKQAAKLKRTIKKQPLAKKAKTSYKLHEIKFNIPFTKRKSDHIIHHPDYDAKVISVKNHCEPYNRVILEIKETTNEYLDWFWISMSQGIIDSRFMLALFPNVKEITESVAAYFGIKQMVDLSTSYAIVVGDGSTCRTGALMANWCKKVISVDPALNMAKCQVKPKNLELAKQNIQDWILANDIVDEEYTSVVVIAVHAHVALQDYLENLLGKIVQYRHYVAVLTIECCVPQFLTEQECSQLQLTSKEYDDWGIHSPHRHVKQWHR